MYLSTIIAKVASPLHPHPTTNALYLYNGVATINAHAKHIKKNLAMIITARLFFMCLVHPY